MEFEMYMKFEMEISIYNSKLVLNRDKTRFLLLIPLNYNGPPGSSLSVVLLFYLNASEKLEKKVIFTLSSYGRL